MSARRVDMLAYAEHPTHRRRLEPALQRDFYPSNARDRGTGLVLSAPDTQESLDWHSLTWSFQATWWVTSPKERCQCPRVAAGIGARQLRVGLDVAAQTASGHGSAGSGPAEANSQRCSGLLLFWARHPIILGVVPVV